MVVRLSAIRVRFAVTLPLLWVANFRISCLLVWWLVSVVRAMVGFRLGMIATVNCCLFMVIVLLCLVANVGALGGVVGLVGLTLRVIVAFELHR